MSDLRGALAISNDVHAELMEAVRDGREPQRVAAAAAARHASLPSNARTIANICASLSWQAATSVAVVSVRAYVTLINRQAPLLH